MVYQAEEEGVPRSKIGVHVTEPPRGSLGSCISYTEKGLKQKLRFRR
jgi:hypothetical protein